MGRPADGDPPGDAPQCRAQELTDRDSDVVPAATAEHARTDRADRENRSSCDASRPRVARYHDDALRKTVAEEPPRMPRGPGRARRRPAPGDRPGRARRARWCALSAVLADLRARVLTAETRAADLEVALATIRRIGIAVGILMCPVGRHRGPGFHRPQQAQPGPRREGAGPRRGRDLHREPLTVRPCWGQRFPRCPRRRRVLHLGGPPPDAVGESGLRSRRRTSRHGWWRRSTGRERAGDLGDLPGVPATGHRRMGGRRPPWSSTARGCTLPVGCARPPCRDAGRARRVLSAAVRRRRRAHA